MPDGYGALVTYREDSLDISFFCYQGSVRRNVDMCGEAEISVLIQGRMDACLCFAYTPISSVSLV